MYLFLYMKIQSSRSWSRLESSVGQLDVKFSQELFLGKFHVQLPKGTLQPLVLLWFNLASTEVLQSDLSPLGLYTGVSTKGPCPHYSLSCPKHILNVVMKGLFKGLR